MELQLSVATPERLVHEGPARFVVLPAADGELGVLPRHAPLIGRLGAGELRLKPVDGGPPLRFFVEGGFLEVLENRVTVLANRAEELSSIDPAREAEALEELRRTRPRPGSPLEVLEEHRRRVELAKLRLRLAERARAS